jgi:hypothetical protein
MSSPVKGNDPDDVVAVVEPLPVPAVPLLTESQALLPYPWHVELARAMPGATSASTARIPTKAEKRFMNPFDRRGPPTTR